MPNFDSFGFNGETSNGDGKPTDDITDLDTGKTGQLDADGNSIDDITNNGNGDGNSDSNANKDNQSSSSTGGKPNDKANDADAEHGLEEGTIIEDGDNKYTVDKDGNLIDDKGNIFKAKNEVAAYLKEFEVEDTKEENTIDVKSIQELVGVSVTSEDGKAVTFENTPQGVASYIQSVIDLKRDEFAQAGVNKLFEDYPIVGDFLNYYVANGNSFEGFGELRDRSGIEVDENNVSQQEAIVREAFKEFNRRGNVDKYIQYLKDSNELFNVAKEELEALQKADNEMREANAKEAMRVKAEEEKQLVEFWNGVKECIDKRQIAGYRIPETVIEGKGDLFKPRMAMFKEWLDEGLIWVRDESTDHIRIVIGRSNNIRKISEDDIFEMGKRVTIFQRGYRILFYDNDEKIVKKIGIKYWIAKCMAKYKEYVELYKKDNISAAEYTILQLTHLPEVAKRIFSQMPSEKIASELNIDLELVKSVERAAMLNLRRV
jgi:hypothetical protein